MFSRIRRGQKPDRRPVTGLPERLASRPRPPLLVAEALEPRLLLSASIAGLGTVKAMHDGLANLATAIGGLEHLAPMTTGVQLVEISGHSTVGTALNLANTVTNALVTPLQGLITADQQNAGNIAGLSSDLASQLQSAIASAIGSGAGNSAAVTDISPGVLGTDPTLHIVVDSQQSIGYTVNLGSTGADYGIQFPTTVGQATVNYHFDLTLDANNVASTATPDQSAFTLASFSFTAGFSVSKNLAGQDFNLGILTLTVPLGASATVTENLAIGGALSASIGGTDLATKATAIQGGDYAALKGAGAFLTNAVTSQTSNATLLDLPVSLVDLHAIPGIASFTDGEIIIKGSASGTDMTVDAAKLVKSLQTATGNDTLDPAGFNNFLVKDLIAKAGAVGDYINNLASGSADLNIPLPLIGDVSIGSLIGDLAAPYKAALIDPLLNPAIELGFDNGSSGSGSLVGHDLTDAVVAALPVDLGIKISLNNGVSADLHFTDSYNGQPIVVLADLVGALNAAITASALNTYVAAAVNGHAIELDIIATGHGAPTTISVASPSMFTDIRSFGVALGRLMHLPGWNVSAPALDYGNTLLADLGLAYDPAHNGITVTLSKQFDLAQVTAPFSVSLSLGDLAGLSVTNAQFVLTSSVLLSVTMGYSLDALNTNNGQPDWPTTASAIQDLAVYTKTANTGAAITADQVAGGGATGLNDLQIIGRDGVVNRFEISPTDTLQNLATEIYNAFGRNMTLTLDATTGALTLTDLEPAYGGPTPTGVGLKVASLVAAVQDTHNSLNYTATLAGVTPSGSFAPESQFILEVGKLTPVVVDVAAGSNSVASYVARLNTALAGMVLDPTTIGLASGTTVHYGDLVHASVASNGGVMLTTTIYNEIHTALGADPYLSSQRVAIQSGLRVDPVELMASAMNGSLLPSLFGLVGSDAAGQQNATSKLVGTSLEAETEANRFYLSNTGISANVQASLQPVDITQDVMLSGNLGGVGFTAKLYDASAPSADISLDNYLAVKVSLFLNTPGADAGGYITLQSLLDALAAKQFGSIWSLNLDSGVDGSPFAQLDFKDLQLSIGSVSLTSAAAPEVMVTFDKVDNLLDGKAPEAHVEVTGINKTLAAADLLGGLQQAFDSLDSGFMSDNLPLVGVSLDSILGFGQTFLTALSAAEANPDASLAQVQDAINGVLGANVLLLSISPDHQLIASLNWQPLAVTKQLNFNLDLTSLDALVGGNAVLETLINTVSAITGLGAGGTLNVSAGVDLGLTMGFDLNAQGAPAAASSLLSSLHDGKGLGSDAAGLPDLQFNLASGRTFTVNVGALGANAKVADLVGAINTAAGIAHFATFDATSGKLTFTDTTGSGAAGIGALGFTSSQHAVQTGQVEKLLGTVALGSSDYSKAYSFTLNVGTVGVDLELAADPARTTGSAFVAALTSLLNHTTVSGKALLAEGADTTDHPSDANADFKVALGHLVTVNQDSHGHLYFSGTAAALGTDSHGNIKNALSIGDGTPKLTMTVSSINGSTIVQDLGLGTGGTATISGSGSRALETTLTLPDTLGNRFYLMTGNDPTTHNPLTGVKASFAVVGQNLSFSAGIGPFTADIVGGSAVLASDAGMAKAGTTAFKVGNPNSAPGYVELGLNDTFAGGVAGRHEVTFSALSQLGNPGAKLADLVHVSANAAMSVDLPIYVFGASIGDVKLQLGNLFDSTSIPHLPARSFSIIPPDFGSIHFSLANFLYNPLPVIQGLDLFLGSLSLPFSLSLFDLNVPLIGFSLQGLGAFFPTLHTDIIGTLEGLFKNFHAQFPNLVLTTQILITTGLNDVLQLLHIPGEVYSYVDSYTHPTQIGFVFHFDITLLNTTVNLSADLGIPGLGLKLDNGQANLTVNLDATLGFGYDLVHGFFAYAMGVPQALASWTSNNDPSNVFTANFQTMHSLDLSVAVSLASGFTTTLNLGFLTAQATNGTLLTASAAGQTITGTSLTGDIFLDVGPNATGPKLFSSQFSQGSAVQAGVDLKLNVDLLINTGFGFGAVSMALPSVTTELTFAYQFTKDLVGHTGVAASRVTDPITFHEVTLDVGSFLTQIMLPILNDLEIVIGPLQPIIDFIQAPIPGISQIIGPTSLLDLAQWFSPGPDTTRAVEFVHLIDEINGLYHALQSNPGNFRLDFGTFVLGHSSDPSAKSLAGSSVNPFGSSIAKTDLSGAEASYNNAASAAAAGTALDGAASSSHNSAASSLKGLMQSGVIDIPILKNPLLALEMLMGVSKPIDLIKVHLPQFHFSFNAQKSFFFAIGPVPVEVDIYFRAGLTINLGFGYDTYGIQQFIKDKNALELLNGFYIDDTLGPQMVFNMAIGISAEVNLVLIKAGIGGEINGTVSFTLADPNHDGKVRASELLYEIENNPLHMFVIDGSINFRIYAFAWVGIDLFFGEITIFEVSFDIINITLLSFHYDYAAAHSTPTLASQSGDKLTLNLGENADQQEVGGNIANPNQELIINGTGTGAGTVSQPGVGAPTTYSGVNAINANLGDGNNNVVFTGHVTSDVSITGGNGNNVVDLSGVVGDPVVALGDGNNLIKGDPVAANTLTGGNGNNTVRAGNAGDYITVGGGNNLIVGGTGNDTIIIEGSGNNTIFGDAGNDVIQISGNGANVIYGGAGSDNISIAGAGNNIIFAHGPTTDADVTGVLTPTLTGGGTTINGALVAAAPFGGPVGNATIHGGQGNDTIFGDGGNNSIVGGVGQNVIFGSYGQVALDGAGGILQISDSLAQGGNNTIAGGAGSNVIIGGAGNNSISGGAGTDIILAGTGSVDGAAGGSNHQYSIVSSSIGSGADTVDGGSGNDVIMGGTGTDVLLLGSGDVLAFGDLGTVVRDGALGSAHLISAQTTAESLGGADTITAGNGNDMVFGGGGADSIALGLGTNVVLGDFGLLTATSLGTQLTILGQDADNQWNGADTISAVGSSIVMGGGGNNVITTLDRLSLASGSDPAVTPDERLEVVFGAAGLVTADYAPQGGFTLHQAGNVEMANGGNDTITTGDGNDAVFGGPGADLIRTGSGNLANGFGSAIVLAHYGDIAWSNGNADITATTRDGDPAAYRHGNDTVDGYGSTVVMGGGGNNLITTHDILSATHPTNAWTEVVFGGDGNANLAFDAAGRIILLQGWTRAGEENFGGNNTIRLGDANDVAIGGAGTQRITAGNGNNILLGHLGRIDQTLPSHPDVTGATPDIRGYDAPQDGSTQPTPAAIITAGDGNNSIMGGSGNNIIVAGIGNNVLFGASGQITRQANGHPLVAETTEECIGGNESISVGRHGEGFGASNVVFGGYGQNTIIGGDGDNKVFGHSGSFTWYANGNPQQMLSRDWDCGLDVLVTLGNGNNDVLGGKGSNNITGGNGHNLMMADQGLIIWNDDGTRNFAESQKDPGPAGNSTVHGGDGNNDIIGGPNHDLLVGGNGTNIIIGYNGQIFFDHGVEIRAQTYAPYIGERHTIVGGTGHDFLIGGTLGNNIVGDPLNDLIFPEQGKIDLSHRIAKWEQPPFFIDSVASPIYNWFHTDAYFSALAGDPHTTQNGDPTLTLGLTGGMPVLYTLTPPSSFSLPTLNLQFGFGVGSQLGISPLFNGTLWLVAPEAGGTVVVVTGIGLSAVNTVLTPLWDWLAGQAGGSATGASPSAGGQQYGDAAPPAVPTPIYLVEGDQTLPGGWDLAALAASVESRRMGAPQAWVLDEASGTWLRDEAPAEGPRLVQEDAPQLLIDPPAAGRFAAA